MKKQILALVMGTALLGGCSYLCEECQDGTCAAQPNKVVFRSNPTLFAFNSAQLTEADKAALNKAVEQIKAEKPSKVLVKGYADTTGPAAYNVELSQKRANAVADYLVKEGVCKKKITAKGYGETDVFDKAETAAGRAKNRRVEVVVD